MMCVRPNIHRPIISGRNEMGRYEMPHFDLDGYWGDMNTTMMVNGLKMLLPNTNIIIKH